MAVWPWEKPWDHSRSLSWCHNLWHTSVSETNKKMDLDQICFRDFRWAKKKKKSEGNSSCDLTCWLDPNDFRQDWFVTAEQNLDCSLVILRCQGPQRLRLSCKKSRSIILMISECLYGSLFVTVFLVLWAMYTECNRSFVV